MARKRTATLLYSTEEVLTVLEFFAVGDLSTAVLLRAVKGGVNLPQTNISAIFKVHLSLFLIAQFFITQLTLPPPLSSSAMLHIFRSLWLIPDFPTGIDSKVPSSFNDACGYSNLNKAVSSKFSGSL